MKKSNIKRISFYDLDGTLIKSIHPEDGIKKWEKENNKKFPYMKNHWWKFEDSLNYKLFNIKPYTNIVNILNDDNNNENTITYLLTARQSKLENVIKDLLANLEITLDYYSFKSDSTESKSSRIKKIIKDYPNLEVINIYDDRKVELEKFKEFKNSFKKNIKINIHKAKSGNDKIIENRLNINKMIRETINSLPSIYKKQ